MQMQLYLSQIFAVPTASNTAVYRYCQQYNSSHCGQYKMNFIRGRYSFGKVFISSTKLFAESKRLFYK